MIVGLGGNTVAIFVYLRKYKESSYRTFIVSLAIVDLVTCCAPMMIVVLGLRYPINLFSIWACKMSSFLIYFMCIGSSAILVTIAGERYRKVCVPHGRQLSARMSKYVCIMDVLLGIVLAWPAAVLYGNKSVTNGQDKIVGTKCDVSDELQDTNYPVYFKKIFLLFVNFDSSFVHVRLNWETNISYEENSLLKTTKKILQSDLANIEFPPCNCSLKEDESKEEIVQNICDNRLDISRISTKPNGEETKSVESKGKPHVFRARNLNQNEEGKQEKTVAVTRLFFIITVVYFCSFIPPFALGFATFLNKEFKSSLSFAGTVAYQMFR
ncbi:hypothetical protein ACJMK2_013125 [Sinanodonta woodiana]|uniref:G-protein coupled receptors family 1 profile domain-containing protein n=1 Tax=Sinanodonta woodiana TaxID=1069815 RepID=A0ABD3VAJ3_SINWO